MAAPNQRSTPHRKARAATLAKRRVLAKHPRAFGWRQFSVSDYTVTDGNGTDLASAYYAKDAWIKAARNI
jgi:hypothetical protein